MPGSQRHGDEDRQHKRASVRSDIRRLRYSILTIFRIIDDADHLEEQRADHQLAFPSGSV